MIFIKVSIAKIVVVAISTSIRNLLRKPCGSLRGFSIANWILETMMVSIITNSNLLLVTTL